jgi:hypothetical protein
MPQYGRGRAVLPTLRGSIDGRKRYTATVTDRTRPGVTVRRFASNAEADRHDAEFWRQLPADERVALVWRLSVEQWALLGRQPDEPGLCRSVARIRRR